MKHLYILKTIICLIVISGLHAQTIYVSSTTGNDKNIGTTWDKAFQTLSKALQVAATNNSIISKVLVANGVYYPAGTSNLTALNKDSSFAITRAGLKIYGGYDPKTHQLNNSDATILAGNNCNHILIIAGLPANADSVLLDDVTIAGGFANSNRSTTCNNQPISGSQGAGIYLMNNAMEGKLSLRNCTITNNYASEGGGIYNDHSSPIIVNCNFISNKVNNLGGAAIFNNGGAPQLYGCNFQHNGEGMYGGAIYSYNKNNKSSPIVINCSFSDNMVDQWGAGIYVKGGSFNISNCTFSGNESFSTNESAAGGGGIYFVETTAFITNTTFCGNKVADAAGAGIFSEKSHLTLSNCTFAGNNAKYGGALCSRGNESDIKIYNSILYGNSSDIDKYGNGNIVVNYSILDGGYNGLNNYKADPLFVSAPPFTEAPFCQYKGGHAKYLAYDYHIKQGSQAIDTGNTNCYTSAGGHLTDFDLAGKNRILGTAIDMGAYEYQALNDNPTGSIHQSNGSDGAKPINK